MNRNGGFVLPEASTEAQHPHARGIQAQAPRVVLEHLLACQVEAAAAAGGAAPALEQAAGAVATALRNGRRVIYAGAGSSGLMALSDALEMAGTFGIAPDRTPMLFAGGTDALLHMAGGTEDDEDLASRDFTNAGIAKGDVVICVSASGRTPYTLALARMGSEQGALVVGISNVPDSELLDISDIAVLLDTGPEMVAGSTRMGAGTAQKIALNIISTLAGVHLGHVYDGMMVNVVADNSKLRDRAARIVAQLADIEADQARTALDAAGGAVKAAVLIAAGARDAATADAMLADSGGHIGPALSALQAER